jgi:hypothetical protein
MRSIARLKTAAAIALASVAAGFCLASATAAGGSATDLPKLPNNDVNPLALKAGVTFQASSFPLALRVTPPDATWFGGQGKTITKKRGSYAWAEFIQSPPGKPLGAISMITSLDATPSVAATVAQLRTGGSGASFQATVPARLGGFSGRQFDGQVVGKSHVFVPFSPLSHAATFHPDAYRFDGGEVFRIIVLDVRGKTVVLLLENAALPADQFPSFLTSAAHEILGSLIFPA